MRCKMENVFWGYIPYGLENDEEEATLLEQEYATKENAEKAAQERFDDKYEDKSMDDWEEVTEDGFVIQYSHNEETGEFKRLGFSKHELYYQREPSMESQHGLTLSDLL
jgi:hypothetical protein